MTLTAMRRPKLVLAAIGVRRVKTAVTRMPSPSTHLPPYSSASRPPGYLGVGSDAVLPIVLF